MENSLLSTSPTTVHDQVIVIFFTSTVSPLSPGQVCRTALQTPWPSHGSGPSGVASGAIALPCPTRTLSRSWAARWVCTPSSITSWASSAAMWAWHPPSGSPMRACPPAHRPQCWPWSSSREGQRYCVYMSLCHLFCVSYLWSSSPTLL